MYLTDTDLEDIVNTLGNILIVFEQKQSDSFRGGLRPSETIN